MQNTSLETLIDHFNLIYNGHKMDASEYTTQRLSFDDTAFDVRTLDYRNGETTSIRSNYINEIEPNL